MVINPSHSLLYSIALHFITGLLLYFGMPSLQRTLPNESIIAVDIVNVSELTNIPRRAKPAMKQPVLEEKAPAEKAKPEPSQSENKDTNAAPQQNTPEAIPLPDKKASKPDKKDITPKKEQQKATKEATKKQKPEAKKKKPSDPFADPAFLKTLEASASKPRSNDALQDVLADLEADSDKPFNPEVPLSLSERDSIISQIQKAWNVTSFNGAAEGMRVRLELTLDPSGNVTNIRTSREHSNSSQYEAFVASAERAVRIASPLKNLPPEKFHSWSSIDVGFDSTGVIS